ncbi:MAG TPA: DUF885 family protein [Myxococcales bacterium]|nr:DUF885 family protein [Myxococcales bacterium]
MLAVLALLAIAPIDAAAERFVARYFEQYPTRATQAGLRQFDTTLENLSPERVSWWKSFLGEMDRSARALQANSAEERIEIATLRRAIGWEKFTVVTRDAPRRNPLFWTEIVSDAALYLLLREDTDRGARVVALRSRAEQVPRLVQQARLSLGSASPEVRAPELSKIAAEEAQQLADLFGRGLPQFAPELAEAGAKAAESLRGFADFLAHLDAHGSARLGKDYAEAIHTYLGTTATPADLVRQFERDLVAQRREAAKYGRSVWASLNPGTPVPKNDSDLLRQLFARIESDHSSDVDSYVAMWRQFVPELEALVRQRQVVTLPDPLTVRILPAPPFLRGQAYGGLFAAGPFRPEGDTLLLLPVPPSDADAAQREKFFRAFNRPFSKMIAAHEVMPGHYLQLKVAARGLHKFRALFPDYVFVEGWGTFSERLMLDNGWGGPLERIAHLKKALENCARAIVDVRVHALNASRPEVDRIVRERALQDPQLADNLWKRTLVSPPQLVTYHLGARRFDALYASARKRAGSKFDLRAFTDGLMREADFPAEPPSARR